jgi:outer membrane protein assembly factor BamE (lipoprotein component of BamABCDE complex)
LRRVWLGALGVLLVASACSALQVGHEFPSPNAAQIKDHVTDKGALVALFGEPYQVGLDNGDQTWRWFFAQRSGSDTITKDLTVRFNANGTVKSYSFTSNFPEDMRKLR